MSRDEPPLPPRITGVLLGIWVTVCLILALVVVPTVFALCAPPGTTVGMTGP